MACAAAASVPLCAMLLTAPLRADDEDRPKHHEGFFSRLFGPPPSHKKARRALPVEETETIIVTPVPNGAPLPPGTVVTREPAVREEVVQEPGLRIPPGAVMPPPAARAPHRITERTTTTRTQQANADAVANGSTVRVQSNEEAAPAPPPKKITRPRSKVVEQPDNDPPAPRQTGRGNAVVVEHDRAEAQPEPGVITSSREAIPKNGNRHASPAPSPSAERQSDVAIVGPNGRASRSALRPRNTEKPAVHTNATTTTETVNPPEERVTAPPPQNDLTAAAPERVTNGRANANGKDNHADAQRLPSLNENGSAESPANKDMARGNKEAVAAQRTNKKAMEMSTNAPGVVSKDAKAKTSPKEPATKESLPKEPDTGATASNTPPPGAPKTADLPHAKKGKGDNGVAEASPNAPKDPAKEKAPAEASDKDQYPMGTRTARAGFVHSPYPPYQELDATGMTPGSIARDPITGKIFRVP